MKKLKLYIILLFITTGCVSEFNVPLPSSENQLLVVEGTLISDSVMDFYFSKSFTLNELYPPAGYDDIRVNLILVGSDGYKSDPATYIGNGQHTLPIGKLEENVAYGIEFTYEGDVYRSELLKPLRTSAIDNVAWSQPIENGDVSIHVSTHDDQQQSTYYKWHYIEDWEISASTRTIIFYDSILDEVYFDYSAPTYYCWRHSINDKVLVGGTEKLVENKIVNHILYKKAALDDRFSVLYSVLVTQQAISKSGYEYYLDLTKANEGMGGLFTPQPSQVEGNITCISTPQKKVVGHIEVVHNTSTRRLFIPRGEISTPRISPYCETLENDSIVKLFAEGLTLADIERRGFRISDYFMEEYTFMTASCVDCRESGGSKIKPTFWPNDHQ